MSRSSTRVALALFAALLTGLACMTARADEDPRGTEGEPREGEEGASTPEGESGTHWRAHWPRFHWVEGVLTLGAEAGALAIYFAEPSREVRWTAPAPLDGEVRDLVRLSDHDDRQTARLVSDVLFFPMIGIPFLIDAVLLAGLVGGDADTMLQMMLISAETLAVAHLVHWLASRLVGRVRPSTAECAVADTCVDRGVGPVASFTSGHAVIAYASASLTCIHHANHPWLTGSRGGAVFACSTAMTLATVTSLLRLPTDLHWASDVAISAIIGTVIGFGIPLFHYAHEAPRERRDDDAEGDEDAEGAEGAEDTDAPVITLLPGGGEGPAGATLFGLF